MRPPTPVVLLVATVDDWIAVRFESIDAARDWEDNHGVTAVGVARLMARETALGELTP